MKKLNQTGVAHVFVIVLVVVVLVVGGVGYYVWNSSRKKTQESTTTTSTATTNNESKTEPKQESKNETKDTTKYLEIKEYGVKIVLAQDIEDAYYVMDPYPYLSTHSLDNYKNCNLSVGGSASSVAALSKGKVGDGNFATERLEGRNSLKIDDYYYWIALANGGSCTDPTGDNPAGIELKVRNAFSTAQLQKL